MANIIIEDGQSFTNSNSYIDIAYLVAYASDRGLPVPTSDEQKKQFILRAMDYIESFREAFVGRKTNPIQACQWPREYAIIDGAKIATDHIPELLKKAQAQLVVEQQKRVPLFPEPVTSSVEGMVIEKTVGPLRKRYSDKAGVSAHPHKPIKIASVEIFLRPLLERGQFSMRTIRA